MLTNETGNAMLPEDNAHVEDALPGKEKRFRRLFDATNDKSVATQSAKEAYEEVLARAGVKVRDADDLRVIAEVSERTGQVGYGPR